MLNKWINKKLMEVKNNENEKKNEEIHILNKC